MVSLYVFGEYVQHLKALFVERSGSVGRVLDWGLKGY